MDWFRRNRDYRIRHALRVRQLRTARGAAVAPLRVPASLAKLPWCVGDKEFTGHGTDFLVFLARLLVRCSKKQMGIEPAEITAEFRRVPPEPPAKETQAQAASPHSQ